QGVEVIPSDELRSIRCNVVWVGKPGSKQEGEVGLRALSPPCRRRPDRPFPCLPGPSRHPCSPVLLDSSTVPHTSVLPFVDLHGSLPRAGGTRETHLAPLLSAACALFAGKRM